MRGISRSLSVTTATCTLISQNKKKAVTERQGQMARLAMALAIGLMLLQILTWIYVVRFHRSRELNALYAALAMLMLWCYVLAVAVVPQGQPPLPVLLDYEAIESGDQHSAGDNQPVPRYCDACDCTKPPHVHHCAVCNRCIYRMDHHCPWTGNCVGFNNKKIFLLFVLYTSLACLVFGILSSPLLQGWGQTTSRTLSTQSPLGSMVTKTAENEQLLVRVTWFLSWTIGLVLLGFFLFHLWLLHKGKTTLEFLTDRVGEFELSDGGFWTTASVYFGANKLLWLVPLPPDCLEPQQLLMWSSDAQVDQKERQRLVGTGTGTGAGDSTNGT